MFRLTENRTRKKKTSGFTGIFIRMGRRRRKSKSHHPGCQTQADGCVDALGPVLSGPLCKQHVSIDQEVPENVCLGTTFQGSPSPSLSRVSTSGQMSRKPGANQRGGVEIRSAFSLFFTPGKVNRSWAVKDAEAPPPPHRAPSLVYFLLFIIIIFMLVKRKLTFGVASKS